MKYWDLCLRTREGDALDMAKRLGFAGVGIVQEYQKDMPALPKIEGLEISAGVELKGKEISKAGNLRKNFLLIVANAFDPREALETPEIDILICPEEMNHVLARLAKKNNIAIGFEFSRLLHASKKTRADILHSFKQVAGMVRKYKAPFVLVSGALSKWDLRSPSDLTAFGKILGFEDQEIKKSLSGEIIRENRKRLGKTWVMPGVEVE